MVTFKVEITFMILLTDENGFTNTGIFLRLSLVFFYFSYARGKTIRNIDE